MSNMETKKCTCHAESKNGSRYILGINCDVKTCYFNDSCEHCTAEKIDVGPTYAATSNDTICATFKPKEG